MVQLKLLTIEYDQTIKEALQIIDKNARGICFVINKRNLVGVATDGDIRRALLSGVEITNKILTVMNRDFIALPIESKDSAIRATFNNRLKLIPLCDSEGNLVDVADAIKGHSIPISELELGGKELEYVEECIHTNWISSQGKYVQQFEMMFEEMHEGTTALAVSNGTVALHLALVSLGIGHGDEVIVPDLTFAATANAVVYTGASPVFCDVDPQTWCIDTTQAKKLITSKTKAVIPVHLYGHPCDMTAISDLAQKQNLLIVEDCAEAIGSKWNDKPVGTWGDASTFSFFGNKTISTGEGGMVLFRDEKIAKYAKLLRDHGMSPDKRYWHDVIGFNYRLTNLQAAIGVAQLERFPAILGKKRFIASLYHRYLHNVEGIEQLPLEKNNFFHSYWLYPIRLSTEYNRDEVMRKLLMNGIDSRPFFYPLHLMPPYESYKKAISLEIAEQVAQSGISLPSFFRLEENEIRYISETLTKLLEN